MSTRFQYENVVQSLNGAVLEGANVSVYLTGTQTPASVYTVSTGGTAITTAPQITTSATGAFSFWVDSADYSYTQFFDIVVTSGTYTSSITGVSIIETNDWVTGLVNGTIVVGNASTTPTANQIPVANASGVLNLSALTLLTNARQTAVFTQNGTWTVPAGVTTIYVSGCGGGAGGTSGNANNYGGTGGEAGQSTILQAVSVTPGSSLTITIGAGGASGANGGTTTLANGSTTLVSLAGGIGGYTFGTPTVSSNYGGWGSGGASGPFGQGGGNAGDGGNGTGYGSGGGGGTATTTAGNAGGAGAPGILIIQW